MATVAKSEITRYLFFLAVCCIFNSYTYSQKQPVCDYQKQKGITSHRKAFRVYKKALKLYNDKDLKEASALLEKAVSIDSNFVRAWYMHGEIMVKRGEIEEARNSYERVIDLCPEYVPKVYYYLGNLSYYQKDYKMCTGYLSDYLKRADSSSNNFTAGTELCKYCKAANKYVNNPVPFNPMLIKEISTLADEFMPVFSPDNQLLLYTRKHFIEYDDKNFAYKKEVQLVEELYMSQKINGKFAEGKAMGFPFNNGIGKLGKLTLTINNKEMYITICDDERCVGKSGCDIFYTSYKNGGWEPFKNLNELSDSAINTPYWESSVSIAPDGNTIYFCSDQASEGKHSDIFYIVKNDSTGKWSKPINIGPVINTEGEELAPFIHQDNTTLYFASNGHEGLGGYDLFMTKKDSAGNWSQPVNLGYPINTENDEYDLYVSVDGEKGYIASNQFEDGKGGWDIFSFDLYENIKPQKVLFLKGELLDKWNCPLEDPVLILRNLETREEIPMLIDSTGYYAYVKETEHFNYSLTALSKGYFYDSKILSASTAKAGAVQFNNFNIPEIKKGASFKMDNIIFTSNSYELTNKVKNSLDPLIDFLNLNASVHIAIHGHTDDQGEAKQNQVLSESRAKSVYNYIVEKGIDRRRLSYKGFGESKPIASNQTEEGKRLNRRTEVIITKQ